MVELEIRQHEGGAPAEDMAERRALHNSIERTRREALNAKFSHLAGVMPSLHNVHRPSKSVIISHCLEMVQELKQVRRENVKLKREVEILRRATREAAHSAHASNHHLQQQQQQQQQQQNPGQHQFQIPTQQYSHLAQDRASIASNTPSEFSVSSHTTPPYASMSPPMGIDAQLAHNAMYYDSVATSAVAQQQLQQQQTQQQQQQQLNAQVAYNPTENKQWSYEGVGAFDPPAIPPTQHPHTHHRYSLPVNAFRPSSAATTGTTTSTSSSLANITAAGGVAAGAAAGTSSGGEMDYTAWVTPQMAPAGVHMHNHSHLNQEYGIRPTFSTETTATSELHNADVLSSSMHSSELELDCLDDFSGVDGSIGGGSMHVDDYGVGPSQPQQQQQPYGHFGSPDSKANVHGGGKISLDTVGLKPQKGPLTALLDDMMETPTQARPHPGAAPPPQQQPGRF